jgi:hypothetical protein
MYNEAYLFRRELFHFEKAEFFNLNVMKKVEIKSKSIDFNKY